MDGSLGIGGTGGSSGDGAQTREGAGGGGGLYGGGGGGGVLDGAVGGGGGGSSLVPPNGSLSLASLRTHPSIAITAVGTNLPLTGTSTGTVTVDESAFPLPTHTEFSGLLTQLGRFTGTGNGFFTPGGPPPDFPYTQTLTETLRAADGSELFGTLTGSGEGTSGVTAGINTVTITGGTGRFSGASGGLHGEGARRLRVSGRLARHV